MNDWRSRHPFKIGDRVIPRPNTVIWARLGPVPSIVTMRGEDAYGQWVCVDDGWQMHDVRLYELEKEAAI